MRLAYGHAPERTYGTHANAEAALFRKCAKLAIGEMAYVIASDGAGRFFPIVLPTDKQIQEGIYMAANGVTAVRT